MGAGHQQSVMVAEQDCGAVVLKWNWVWVPVLIPRPRLLLFLGGLTGLGECMILLPLLSAEGPGQSLTNSHSDKIACGFSGEGQV